MTPYLANPYWAMLTNGSFDLEAMSAEEWVSMAHIFTWNTPEPGIVNFITEELGDRVLDPFAGTGYWANLLSQSGADVVATDAFPPNKTYNGYHVAQRVWFPIKAYDAVDAVTKFGEGRSLLMSWPPDDNDITTMLTLKNFNGNKVVYVGSQGSYLVQYGGWTCTKIRPAFRPVDPGYQIEVWER